MRVMVKIISHSAIPVEQIINVASNLDQILELYVMPNIYCRIRCITFCISASAEYEPYVMTRCDGGNKIFMTMISSLTTS